MAGFARCFIALLILNIFVKSSVVVNRQKRSLEDIRNRPRTHSDEVKKVIKNVEKEWKHLQEANGKSTEKIMEHGIAHEAEYDEAIIKDSNNRLEKSHSGQTWDENPDQSGEGTSDVRMSERELANRLDHLVEVLRDLERRNSISSELRNLVYHINGNEEQRRTKRKVRAQYAWFEGIIPFTFNPQHPFASSEDKAVVESQLEVAMQNWEAGTCISFIPWTVDVSTELGHGDYFGIRSASKCAATVGQRSAMQYFSVGTKGCGVGVAMHELGHTMGFNHENSREDRDDYVIYQCWNKADPLDHNYGKKSWKYSQNLAKFDFSSTMMYSVGFSPSSSHVVRNPEMSYLADIGHLASYYDFLSVNKMYNCQGTCDPTICQNDGFINQNNDPSAGCACTCPEGLGGDTCTEIDTAGGYTCGELINVELGDDPTVIQTDNYPLGYTSGGKCAWLITAPEGALVKMRMKTFGLPKSGSCTHWLEVRNNLIGQQGQKFCGSEWTYPPMTSRGDFQINQMMLLFDHSDTSVSSGAGFQFEVSAYKDSCLDNMCLGATCTPGDDEDYTCEYREKEFQCDFNHGCLCYFLFREDTYPQDVNNWVVKETAYEGGYGLTAEVDEFERGTTSVLRTIPFSFDACVSFAYKVEAGRLDVKTYVNNEPACPLFYHDTAMQDWDVKTVKVYRDPNAIKPTDAVQVAFVAHASSDSGDIHIDFINVRPIGDDGECTVDACFGDVCHGYPCVDVAGTAECQWPDDELWSCDFEVDSSCQGLMAVIDDDLKDWVWHYGSTTSVSTGPSHGADFGRYIYMEGSDINEEDKMRMKIDVPFPAGARCLRFHYHMYGSGMGTLNIYQLDGSDETTPIWTRSGDQGNQWKVAKVDTNTGGKIVIEGVRGDSSKSDMAIDLLEYWPFECSQVPDAESITAVPIPTATYTCSFENTALCDYMTQSTADDWDWYFTTGPTPTDRTGPTAGSDDIGGYAYVEASSREDLSTGIIELALPFPQGGDFCLMFDYNMYGNYIGRLNVYTQDINADSLLLWTLTGEQTDEVTWNQAQIDIPFTIGLKLLFEGVRGDSSKGDIGLDNIKLELSPCSGDILPRDADPTTYGWRCGFEVSDLCEGSSQGTEDNQDWIKEYGSTTSSDTGPTSAAVQVSYLYMEASSVSAGETADLIIEPDLDAGPLCVKFYYSMYGSGMGSLELARKDAATSLVTSLFIKSGDQGTDWINTSVNIPSYANGDQLVFTATRGSSSKSDIGIDEVIIYDGNCI